jgi:hypothetical protein
MESTRALRAAHAVGHPPGTQPMTPTGWMAVRQMFITTGHDPLPGCFERVLHKTAPELAEPRLLGGLLGRSERQMHIFERIR